MSSTAADLRPSRALASAARRARGARRAYDAVAIVVAIGLLVTTGFALISASLASSNERHLLDLRSKEVGSALTSSLPDVRTPLGAAVALADVTDGSRNKFRQFAASYVGVGRQFMSLSVWRTRDLAAGPVDVVGTAPKLGSTRASAVTDLSHAAAHPGLAVWIELHAKQPLLDYASVGAHPGPFIVVADQALPPHRYTRLPPNSAYSDLNVAVYIAKHAVPSRLLLSTVKKLPLSSPSASTVVRFGSASLDVVVSARQPLGGSLPARMPFVIVILGLLLTTGAGVLTFRLISGRRNAQALAAENRRLYAEQRGIAQHLQHALLPEELPDIEGAVIAAVYDAGAPGVDIGGDWYDLIRLGPERLLLVVGDVSGRGIKAATAMASLRFAIQYAAQTEPPEVFLGKLSSVRSLRANGQLATVLCVAVNLRTREVSVTSAGHLPPLMIHDGHGEFLWPQTGVPVGVNANSSYTPTVFTLPPGATLLGFTDGLVERRGETLDEGLDRLRRAAAAHGGGRLDDLLARLLEQVRGSDSTDDTAIAGIQWMN